MSLDLPPARPVEIQPKPNRLGFRLGIVAIIVVLALGVAKAWDSGFGPSWKQQGVALRTLDVEQGDLAVWINETGTTESAANTTIRCQVEAMIGQVGGASTSKSQGANRTTSSGSGGQSGGAPAANAPSGNTAAGAAKNKSGAASGKNKSKSSSKKSSGGGSGGGGSSGGSSSSGGGGSGGGASGGGGMGGGGGSGGGGGMSGGSGGSGGGSGGSGSGGSGGSKESSGVNASSPVAVRPTIRSFTYSVPAYQSLRATTKGGAAQAKSSGGSGGNRGGGGGGGGGNRGGGGGGGGGGAGGQQETPGSTRIIMIKPEGSEVTAGELVCELDSAPFRDEVIAQQIRFDEAKARLIQAKSILEVNEISLSEYRDGIFKQDLQLIRQYLSSCRTEEDRARRNLQWSAEVYQKGYRAPAQYQADILSLERAEIALAEALRMETRLIDYTGPKLIKSLEAKLEANKADVFAQESAFQLESDRLRRLQEMVENCTLRAPREGIVVYSLPPSSGWRPPTAVIMEGATVRQGQAIFELPDSRKMRVRAKINESKVGSIQVGQKAAIRIDAFPDKVLDGTVTEVTAIPAPGGLSSDIRIYFANVAIDVGGFEGLRPGLSTQVQFFVDSHREAIKVPLQAVRWVDNQPFVAVTTTADQTQWRWQPLEIGLTNESYAEVLKGLKPGEKVVADPNGLTAPEPVAPTVLQAGGPSTSPRG